MLSTLVGCSRKEIITNEVLKIDIQKNTINDLPNIDINSIVPLETNKSSLIGHIASIECFSDRIVLLDIFLNKSVMVFSFDGLFIKKTKLGKGPGELINPFAIFIDENNESILVWDQNLSSMFTFDLDLNLKTQDKYNVPIIDFAILNNDQILLYNHYKGDYTYHLFSPSSNSVEKSYIPDFQYSGIISLFRSISINKRILLITPYDYNIYKYANKSISSEYYLDFGNYNILKKDIKNNSISKNWDLINAGIKVSSPHEIDESEKYLLFHVYFKNSAIYFVHSNEEHNTYRLNDYFDMGILPKCQIRGLLKDNKFFAIVEPGDLLKFQEKGGEIPVGSEIKIQQNPFFMVFSINDL